jgi:hypothetical protein
MRAPVGAKSPGAQASPRPILTSKGSAYLTSRPYGTPYYVNSVWQLVGEKSKHQVQKAFELIEKIVMKRCRFN